MVIAIAMLSDIDHREQWDEVCNLTTYMFHGGQCSKLVGDIIGGDPIVNHIHNMSLADFTKTIL
eukprot:14087649-Ditylum_brightwellii.AAC.1